MMAKPLYKYGIISDTLFPLTWEASGSTYSWLLKPLQSAAQEGTSINHALKMLSVYGTFSLESWS